MDEEINYLKLYNPIETIEIKGVSDKTISNLGKLGLCTIMDVLYFFPRTYEDRTNIKTINRIRPDEYVVLQGKILNMENMRTRTRKTIFRISFSDGTGIINLKWFQMPYLKKNFSIGDELIVIGQVKKTYQFEIINPEYKKVKEGKEYKAEILPVYPAIRTITQNVLRKSIIKILNKYKNYLQENIPDDIVKKYKLLGRIEALDKVHNPQSKRDMEEAKRRFAVEELLTLELGILSKRFELELKNKEKYKLQDKKHLVKKFLDTLHFELTTAQKRVITEIYKDLNKGKLINRLIQGDVGSGKTIVAVIMLLYMVENGYQGVFMAPTEILASQHYLSMIDILNELGLRTEILTGSIKGKKREKLLDEIRQGTIHIVVGTHALIEDNVEFHKLGLIIIDEQHRFGVVQRKKLRDKGVLANLLVMSATPIPRSLALSIYGDLDISIIDELPPGRIPIKTKWIKGEIEQQKMYDFIIKKLREGRQVYFVSPLIDESESLSVKSATALYDELSENQLKSFNLGLLHGRMKNNEKESVMSEFKKGNLDVIVSTTVIEVGVNVPNASIMVISDANRFGLSALHQLRGRVGRGEHRSYCFMIADTDNDISKSRLQVMEETTDGFKIAEEDLRLRKPGEIFGTRQSGMSDLKFVDIVHDVKTIKLVRDIAFEYLQKNNGEINNVYMRRDIKNKFDEDILGK